MDWQLDTTSVVILGSGFSAAATDGKSPLMRSFFDQLDAKDFPLLHEFVSQVSGDPRSANVESILLTLDQIRTSPRGVLEGWADRWMDNTSAINQQLASYTLSRLRPCLDIAEDNWAANLLAESGPDTVVISMNYDIMAERILSNRDRLIHGDLNPTCPHCKMRGLLRKGCSCDGKQEIYSSDWLGALIKPHGSIAWKRCLNRECCSYECLVAHEHCQPFEPFACPYCNQKCGPVLVMPTMSKNLSDTPEIAVMWQAARRAIAEAESILMIGFSMTASDELLLTMIRASIHTNKRIRRVGSVDLSPNGVLERFRPCIPRELRVEFKPYPVLLGEAPGWL